LMTTSDRTRLDSRASNKSVWFFAALKESLETWIRPERIELPSHPGYPHSAETAAIFKIRFKGADSFIVLPQTNISDCGTPRIFPVRIGLDFLQHLFSFASAPGASQGVNQRLIATEPAQGPILPYLRNCFRVMASPLIKPGQQVMSANVSWV